MRPTSEECAHARAVSEANARRRARAERAEFTGAVGQDVLPWLSQAERVAMALERRGPDRRPVIDALPMVIAVLVLTGVLSGLALAAGLV